MLPKRWIETCRDKSTWGNKSYRSSRGTFSNKGNQMLNVKLRHRCIVVLRGKGWRQESVNYLKCKKHSFIRWGFIVGSLSSDDFERRTSTGSEPFSLLICLDATKFILLKCFYSYKHDLLKKLFKVTAQECKRSTFGSSASLKKTLIQNFFGAVGPYWLV